MALLCGLCCFFVSFTCPLCATTGARLRFADAVHHQGRHFPFRGAEAIEIPLLPYMWWLTSLLLVQLPQLQPVERTLSQVVHFSCRGAEAHPHGLATHEFRSHPPTSSLIMVAVSIISSIPSAQGISTHLARDTLATRDAAECWNARS